MFNTEVGGQVAWLVPLAVAGLVAGLWLTRRRPRTDLARAGWLLWGLWAAVCVAVFSFSEGIFHPYYTVQLAPAVAALAGAGGLALWQLGRVHRALRWALPAAVVVTAGLAVVLLARTPDYAPWLRPLIIVGAALAAAGLWLGSMLRRRGVVVAGAALAVAALLAGPAAYALTTVADPVSGSLVSAGPTAATAGPAGAGGRAPGEGSTAVDQALVRLPRGEPG